MAEESKNNESISKEIRNLEREVLKDLISIESKMKPKSNQKSQILI